MDLNIILAMDKNGGIGKDNKLPWRLKTDMAFFKDLTTSLRTSNVISHYFVGDEDLIAPVEGDPYRNAVVMGRKTWDSIPKKFKPLPNRTNIVLSKTASDLDGSIIFGSFEKAVDLLSSGYIPMLGHVFIIGGAQIYKEALKNPSCRTVYVTSIDKEFDCDTFIDLKDLEPFRTTKESKVITESEVNYTFKILERK